MKNEIMSNFNDPTQWMIHAPSNSSSLWHVKILNLSPHKCFLFLSFSLCVKVSNSSCTVPNFWKPDSTHVLELKFQGIGKKRINSFPFSLRIYVTVSYEIGVVQYLWPISKQTEEHRNVFSVWSLCCRSKREQTGGEMSLKLVVYQQWLYEWCMKWNLSLPCAQREYQTVPCDHCCAGMFDVIFRAKSLREAHHAPASQSKCIKKNWGIFLKNVHSLKSFQGCFFPSFL